MKRFAYLAALAVMGVGLGLAQLPGASAIVVQRRYDAPEGAWIEGRGVCSLSPDAVTCWDMDKRPDSQLTELVRARLLTGDSDIRLRYHRINRTLVVRASPGVSAWFQTASGSSLQGQSVSSSPGFPSVYMVPVSVEPEVSDVAIQAVLGNVVPPKTETMPFKVGAVATVAGKRYRLDGWDKVSERANQSMSRMSEPRTSWQIRLVDADSGQQAQIAFEPLDKDENVIRATDKRGRPTSNRGTPTIGVGRSGPFWGTGNSYVDPAYIRFLRLTVSESRRVELRGFPLDPERDAR